MIIDMYKNVRKMKPKEVAQILGVSERTLYRWDKVGVLKTRRTQTHRRYYLESDVQDYIKNVGM